MIFLDVIYFPDEKPDGSLTGFLVAGIAAFTLIVLILVLFFVVRHNRNKKK